MKRLHEFSLPLLSGWLYGLSWPLFEEINLSFLAWFAFVPLFRFLEKNTAHFWKSMLGSYLVMVIFECITAGWLFMFPQEKTGITFIFMLEEVWFFMPFFFLFLLQKKIGFSRALWLFPLVWMLWEWTYLPLEFTMGTHISAYSQSSNLWLIQFIDITGMWGISLWLMLFNVLVYQAWKAVGYNFLPALVSKQLLAPAGLMLGVPLLYSAYAYSAYGDVPSKKSLQVTLIPTQYSAAYLLDTANHIPLIEETLHRTDSVAFRQIELSQPSDLYVWPETGLSFELGFANLGPLLHEAVTDWKSALLAGGKGIVQGDSTDQRFYVSGLLISHTTNMAEVHNKTVLTPGQESIPYYSALKKMGVPVNKIAHRFYRKGEESVPVPLMTKSGNKFLIGVSLCFEQWYPQHWVNLANNGAEVYAHLAAEGWYGNVGFRQFMANVSRMRCIENRKPAVRCANVGLSMFIDRLGNYRQQSLTGTLRASTANVYASDQITFYARFPDLFPLGGALLLITLFAYSLYRNSHSGTKKMAAFT